MKYNILIHYIIKKAPDLTSEYLYYILYDRDKQKITTSKILLTQ